MVLAKPHNVDKSNARKALKADLLKKLEIAKTNHHTVLKDAKISTNFASITASVVGERLTGSRLDLIFNSLLRDIAIANKVHIFVHPMRTIDIHYVDHNSGASIEKITKRLSDFL